jgi:uncharacterized membrane protein
MAVDVNRALYYVLVSGMVMSTGLFVVGLVLQAAPGLQPLSWPVLYAATVVLIATPVTRTFVGTLAFAYNREGRQALVSGTVFAILMLSIFLGFVMHFSP